MLVELRLRHHGDVDCDSDQRVYLLELERVYICLGQHLHGDGVGCVDGDGELCCSTCDIYVDGESGEPQLRIGDQRGRAHQLRYDLLGELSVGHHVSVDRYSLWGRDLRQLDGLYLEFWQFLHCCDSGIRFRSNCDFLAAAQLCAYGGDSRYRKRHDHEFVGRYQLPRNMLCELRDAHIRDADCSHNTGLHVHRLERRWMFGNRVLCGDDELRKKCDGHLHDQRAVCLGFLFHWHCA